MNDRELKEREMRLIKERIEDINTQVKKFNDSEKDLEILKILGIKNMRLRACRFLRANRSSDFMLTFTGSTGFGLIIEDLGDLIDPSSLIKKMKLNKKTIIKSAKEVIF